MHVYSNFQQDPFWNLGGINPGAAAFLPSNIVTPLPTARANDGTPQTSNARPLFELGGVNPGAAAFLPSNTMLNLPTARANGGTPQTSNV